MEAINEYTIKILILLIPGIIAIKIYETLTIRNKSFSVIKIVIGAMLFAGFSYRMLWVIFYSINTKFKFQDHSPVWKYLTKDIECKICLPCLNGISWPIELGLASFIGLGLALIVVWIKENRWLRQKIRSTFKYKGGYGSEDLFSYFLNTKDVKKIRVIDFENKIVYEGNIKAFHERDNICEILLEDVTVYKYDQNEGDKMYKKLYSADRIYLSKPKDKLVIETHNNNKKQKKISDKIKKHGRIKPLREGTMKSNVKKLDYKTLKKVPPPPTPKPDTKKE